jgi:hypothetical protein
VAQLALMFGPSEREPGGSSFPVARVSVKGWSADESGEVIYLSPPCVSARELEAAVDGLRRQLDKILAEGRQRFAKA